MSDRQHCFICRSSRRTVDIRLKRKRIEKILPDDTDAEVLQIDDSNLRTLLFKLRKRIRDAEEGRHPKGVPVFDMSRRSRHMVEEMKNLCDMLLLRNFAHVVTHDKVQTMDESIVAVLGNSYDSIVESEQAAFNGALVTGAENVFSEANA